MRKTIGTLALSAMGVLFIADAAPAGAATCANYAGACPAAVVSDSTPAAGDAIAITDHGLTAGDTYTIIGLGGTTSGTVAADGSISITIPSGAAVGTSYALTIQDSNGYAVSVLGLTVGSSTGLTAIEVTDPYICGGNIWGEVESDDMAGVTVTLELLGAENLSFTFPVEADGSYTFGINYTDPAHPNYVPDGAYLVTYTATDAFGNSASGSYSINLTDDCDVMASPNALPFTGASSSSIALYGLAAMAGGGVFVGAARRLRPTNAAL